MDRRSEFAAGHLGFCLAEMLAEIDDQLSQHAAVRALEQLEARNKAGEPLTTVDAASLRTALASRIDADPRTMVRRKLLEINALLTTGGAEPAARTQATANVTDLTAFRQEKASSGQPVARPRKLRRLVGAVAGLAIVAVASLASIPSPGWIGRSAGMDILTAIARPSPVTPVSRVGIVDSH